MVDPTHEQEETTPDTTVAPTDAIPEDKNTNDNTVSAKTARPPVDAIRVGGTRYQIPTLALGAMLVAILAPTVMYSTNLRGPTPAELLIAICIAMFSGVLSLWVLDITDIL